MNPNCSFWDEEQEDWSQDGCVLVSGITSSDERYDEEIVRCACDHLTNFAVIMVSEKQLGKYPLSPVNYCPDNYNLTN